MRLGGPGAGLPSVLDEIDKNLHEFMSVQAKFRHFGKFAHDLNVPVFLIEGVQAQHFLDHIGDLYDFIHGREARITLLRGDDLLDVVKVADQPGDFLQ